MAFKPRCVALFAAAALASPAAFALDRFSPLVNLPADVKVGDAKTLTWDRVSLQLADGDFTHVGRVTRAVLAFVPEGNRPAEATWSAWAPFLKKSGWKVTGGEGGRHALSRQDPDGERYLAVLLGDYEDPQLVLIEPAKKPTFSIPAPQPGKASAADDFPYLPAYPGTKLTSTDHRDDDQLVTLPGASEPTIVGTGAVEKSYQPPTSLSAYELETVMREALARAGWEVQPAEDPNEVDGFLWAHYAKNGRNIWAWIVRAADDSGGGVRYLVADVGAEDWAKRLKDECRLTLFGVNFDFNKASLRPESTPVLEKAADALKASPALKIEVGGHTDNVGDDAYNDRLSGQRAETVRAWLAAHGVPSARLSARGYGKKKPIADNDSDAGRAKNRRVELSCTK